MANTHTHLETHHDAGVLSCEHRDEAVWLWSGGGGLLYKTQNSVGTGSILRYANP